MDVDPEKIPTVYAVPEEDESIPWEKDWDFLRSGDTREPGLK